MRKVSSKAARKYEAKQVARIRKWHASRSGWTARHAYQMRWLRERGRWPEQELA
jgi:hypothetical protein